MLPMSNNETKALPWLNALCSSPKVTYDRCSFFSPPPHVGENIWQAKLLVSVVDDESCSQFCRLADSHRPLSLFMRCLTILPESTICKLTSLSEISRICCYCSKRVHSSRHTINREIQLLQIWHKQCFKCQGCGMILNMRTYKGFNKQPYCEA